MSNLSSSLEKAPSTLILAMALGVLAGIVAAAITANAAGSPIYTLPFLDTYTIVCRFHCYYNPETEQWHEGTDIVVGESEAGEDIVAAADGDAYSFNDTSIPGAGLHISMDHGGGNRTRYLHLNDDTVSSQGQHFARGALVGHEGSSGTDDGFVHLHFEARIDAPDGFGDKVGTAVDPWDESAWMWTTNPPSYPDTSTPTPTPSPTPSPTPVPCIIPQPPYGEGELWREEHGTAVYVVWDQTKYWIREPEDLVDMQQAGLIDDTIQCAVDGWLSTITNIPNNKTLVQEFATTDTYVVDCTAKFLIPTLGVRVNMTNNGYADLPVYYIPPGSSGDISDTPTDGCPLREITAGPNYITCRSPDRKWAMSSYAQTVMGHQSDMMTLWPAGETYLGALEGFTTLDQVKLNECPDYDGDPDYHQWSNLSEQYMGTDPTIRCAANSTANNEDPPDRWPADFNDDQKNTILDTSTFGERFGSHPPQPEYDRRWDLNTDDKITITDVSTMSSLFGKSCAS